MFGQSVISFYDSVGHRLANGCHSTEHEKDEAGSDLERRGAGESEWPASIVILVETLAQPRLPSVQPGNQVTFTHGITS